MIPRICYLLVSVWSVVGRVDGNMLANLKMPMPISYVYDSRSRRYRDSASGHYVTASQVRQAVDAVIDAEDAKVAALSERLVDGDISLADWQSQMAGIMKTLHVTMGVAAVGGFNQADASDFGYMGSLIKKQYQYLQNFANDIVSGKQALDGSLVSRAELYAQAGRGVFEDMVGREAENGGATQERSVLGAADHCGDCLGEAAKDWSPLNSLIPIGERQCLARCHCTMEYK